MGSNVMVVFKVFPESPEDSDKVEAGLKAVKTGVVQEVRKEPVAFGLSVFRIGVKIPDKTEGLMDKLEEEIRAIEGVSEVETESATLI